MIKVLEIIVYILFFLGTFVWGYTKGVASIFVMAIFYPDLGKRLANLKDPAEVAPLLKEYWQRKWDDMHR